LHYRACSDYAGRSNKCPLSASKITTWIDVCITLAAQYGEPNYISIFSDIADKGVAKAHKPTQSTTFAQFGHVGWVDMLSLTITKAVVNGKKHQNLNVNNDVVSESNVV
jgi:hypothetical protein